MASITSSRITLISLVFVVSQIICGCATTSSIKDEVKTNKGHGVVIFRTINHTSNSYMKLEIDRYKGSPTFGSELLHEFSGPAAQLDIPWETRYFVLDLPEGTYSFRQLTLPAGMYVSFVARNSFNVKSNEILYVGDIDISIEVFKGYKLQVINETDAARSFLLAEYPLKMKSLKFSEQLTSIFY